MVQLSTRSRVELGTRWFIYFKWNRGKRKNIGNHAYSAKLNVFGNDENILNGNAETRLENFWTKTLRQVTRTLKQKGREKKKKTCLR